MLSRVQLLPGNRQSQLKGHVKSRRGRRLHVQFDPRKVMEGVTAASDEAKDAVKPARPARNLERCPGHKTEGRDPGNIGEIEGLKRLVVGYVEESTERVGGR